MLTALEEKLLGFSSTPIKGSPITFQLVEVNKIPFLLSYIYQTALQAFSEWKAARREELSSYQKQIHDEFVANVEKDLERRLSARNTRKGNNDANLQETMDKELETHRLEHGPKARKIPRANNEDEEEVEDINVGEDDMMMDDVLGLDDNERADELTKGEIGNGNPPQNTTE